MPYNEAIEARIQAAVSSWENVDSRKMFGGICHLLQGNMFCGVYKDFLILRLGGEKASKAMELPFVKPFDITGKPMTGWIMVEPEGFGSEADLKDWLDQARKFVSRLAPK